MDDAEDLESLSREQLLKVILGLRQEILSLRQRVGDLERKDASPDPPPFQINTEPNDDGDANVDANMEVLYETASEKFQVLEHSCPKSTEVPSPQGPRSSCFNCLGDHMIAECKEPRDPRAIARNKRAFQQANAGSVKAAPRYHLDEVQKFNHIRPGLPSTKLRRALGLRSNQLPSYVYRMRVVGYPPGWLKEAEIKHSGVALYMPGGRALPDLSDEEGEIADSTVKVAYDLSKIVEWPGFNVEPPADFVDETALHRCPQMQENHRKSQMLLTLKSKVQKAYVRGQMQDTSVKKGAKKDEVVAMKDSPAEVDVIAEDKQLLTPSRESVNKSNAVCDGTPIPAVFSPYDSLPDRNSWAKDTTDHVLFENLPDSTGKWDQMVEVIKRGRKLREAAEADSSKDEESCENSAE